MKNLTLDHGWVWLVYRINKLGNGKEQWHLQGVAGTEQLATDICLDENYLIGPVPINTSLPEERLSWVGSKFPLRSKPVTKT